MGSLGPRYVSYHPFFFSLITQGLTVLHSQEGGPGREGRGWRSR